MKKILYRIFIYTTLLSLPLICAIGYFSFKIFLADDPKFHKERILEILAKESLLLYSDGISQLGSLFTDTHRIYVPIEQIPQVMKDAIIAAEDQSFYTNFGINIKGIIRASLHNFYFNSRQGASTITQQTVKNLYGRKNVNLKTKFYEMLDAFKLEHIYSKEQILEFYLNQFHVTGNGRGIGIAAKYYFNKDPWDLNLIEAAFIAGSVKGPEKYNPFNRSNIDEQQRAQHAAFIRKNYVLDRMLENKKISPAQYEAAIKLAIPFNQGKFQYNELTINKIIQTQLAKAEILQAIDANNVDAIAGMGLRITTTIDKDIQSAAQYGLKQNLSSISMILDGFSLESVANFKNIQKPELHKFYVGQIIEVNKTPQQESLKLNFGIPSCIVDTSSIERIAVNSYTNITPDIQKSKEKLLNFLRPGQTVLASIKNIAKDGSLYCDLENNPKIQGAALVLDKGKIIAIAGGFFSNDYNRAIYAKRQPGSTFKIPTFYAALQMGWSALDAIPNMRNVFPWQGHLYFPRPDHQPKSLETTMLGAGATSENLASVWIMQHLLDRLNYDQFKELLQSLNLLIEDDNKEKMLNNLRNKFNINPNDIEAISEGILNKLKDNYLSDLNIVNNDILKIFISTLHYGGSEFNLLNNSSDTSAKEISIQKNLVKNNFLRWYNLAIQAKNSLKILDRLKKDGIASLSSAEKEALLSFATIKKSTQHLAYNSALPWLAEQISPLVNHIETDPVKINQLLKIIANEPRILDTSNILLDGVVPLNIIEDLHQKIGYQLKEILKLDTLERLFWHADFKYSLGIYYTAQLVKAMGINESLQWIPSFPLGSNAITLAELALMYQTLLNGKIFQYFNTGSKNQLIIIKRIEDANGNLLWEPKAEESSIVDKFYSGPILNIMRATVTAGTAYNKLNDKIILRSNDEKIDAQLLQNKIVLPIFGKTGTTNNFTNGTYIGFLPYPSDENEELATDNAYTIASYLGYDNNKPMLKPWYKGAGSSAIPAWETIATAIIKSQNFADKLQWKQLIEKKVNILPFLYANDLIKLIVPINSGNALTIDRDDQANNDRYNLNIYLDGTISDGVFMPKRKVSFFNENKN